MDDTMLITKKLADGRVRYQSRPLLIDIKDAYIRPKIDFKTSTSVWMINELIRRRVGDWRRITGEDGHHGLRSILRKDSVFTGTHSIFPIPLVEYILVRYGGEKGNKIIDPFAGGPPRAIAASLMGFNYFGFEVRQDQIDENKQTIKELGLKNINYVLGDGRFLKSDMNDFDFSISCPPYWNVEQYSNQSDDISNFPTYESFNAAMQMSAWSLYDKLKVNAFATIVVGNFRNKKTGELIDFRSHTVENYVDAGFDFYDDVILCRNFGSAAQRASTSWKGQKLVRIHEHLLVFRKVRENGL